jgi:hypothetical protein
VELLFENMAHGASNSKTWGTHAGQLARVTSHGCLFARARNLLFAPHFSRFAHSFHRLLFCHVFKIKMVNRIAFHSSSPSKVTKRLPVDEIVKHPHSPNGDDAVSVASSLEDSSSPLRGAVVVSPDHHAAADIDQLPMDELTLSAVLKSEHKIAEEMGEFAEEPLLKESKHRFVLFPIQDNDVSDNRVSYSSTNAKYLLSCHHF